MKHDSKAKLNASRDLVSSSGGTIDRYSVNKYGLAACVTDLDLRSRPCPSRKNDGIKRFNDEPQIPSMLSLRPLILQVALRLSGPMSSGCELEPYRHPGASLQSSEFPHTSLALSNPLCLPVPKMCARCTLEWSGAVS